MDLFNYQSIIWFSYVLPIFTNFVNEIKEYLYNLFYKTIKVSSTNAEYVWIKSFITQNALNVHTLDLLPANSAAQNYLMNHNVNCGLSEGKYLVSFDKKVYNIRLSEKEIQISTYFWNKFDSIVNFMNASKTQKGKFKKSITINNNDRTAYGGWVAKYIFPRHIDTIILPKSKKERILKSVDDFKESRNLYESLGIPYKKGFLFHGVAGTGKTSLMTVIAERFDVSSIYSVDLTQEVSETFSALKKVKDCVIVIEDIDRYFKKETVEQTNSNDENGLYVQKMSEWVCTFRLQSLMNMLDGMNSPENALIILTANNIDVLPKDLIRPGRIDLVVEFEHSEYSEIVEYAKLFYKNSSHKIARQIADTLTKNKSKVTISLLQKHFLNYKDSIEDAYDNIDKLFM